MNYTINKFFPMLKKDIRIIAFTFLFILYIDFTYFVKYFLIINISSKNIVSTIISLLYGIYLIILTAYILYRIKKQNIVKYNYLFNFFYIILSVIFILLLSAYILKTFDCNDEMKGLSTTINIILLTLTVIFSIYSLCNFMIAKKQRVYINERQVIVNYSFEQIFTLKKNIFGYLYKVLT